MRSPRWRADGDAFARQLTAIKVFETDSIASLQILSQDGNAVEHELHKAELHIDATETGINLYIPLDEVRHQLCLQGALPAAFGKWLMEDPSTLIAETLDTKALHALSAVMINSRKGVILGLLDRQSITNVELPELLAALQREPSPNTPTAPPREPEVSIEVPQDRIETIEVIPGEPSSLGAYHPVTASGNVDSSVIGATSSLEHVRIEDSHPLFEPLSPVQDNYGVLLSRVISAASLMTFPAAGTAKAVLIPDSSLRGPRPRDGYYGNLPQSEVLKRIGAAGELFVSTLEPPRSFSPCAGDMILRRWRVCSEIN